MTFTIHIKVDANGRHIKDECIDVLSKLFEKKGVGYDVGYYTDEIDTDNIGRA